MKYKNIVIAAATAALVAACAVVDPDGTIIAPALVNSGVSDVARTSAVLNGRIEGNTGVITKVGFKYSTSHEFPADKTDYVYADGSASSFSCKINNLSPNQTYYYTAIAEAGYSTATATTESFTTSTSGSPTFGGVRIVEQEEDYLTLRTILTEVGDDYLLERGVSYKTINDKNWINVTFDETNVAVTDSFTVNITDLDPNTKYEVRPYAKNSSDKTGEAGSRTGYGSTMTIETSNRLAPKVEIEGDAESLPIGINSVTVSALLKESSTGSVSECGFVYSSVSSKPTIYNNEGSVKAENTAVGKSFKLTIPNLKTVTEYSVRAYAKNVVNGQERYGYSSVITFKTEEMKTPQIEWDYSVGSSTPSTLSAGASITTNSYDENALKEKGYLWVDDSFTEKLTLENSKVNKLVIQQDGKAINGTIEGLNQNAGYIIVAYAIYEASGLREVGYSMERLFHTGGLYSPSINWDYQTNDVTPSSITVSSYISGGTFDDSSLVEKGYIWAPSSEIKDQLTLATPGVNRLKVSGEGKVIKAEITGLIPNTNYVVVPYAIYKESGVTEEPLGPQNGFLTSRYTDCEMINLSWQSNFDGFQQSFKVSKKGDGDIKEVGVIWHERPEGDTSWPEITFEKNCDGFVKATYDETANVYNVVVTDLKPNTDYFMTCYAKQEKNGYEWISYPSNTSGMTRSLEMQTEIASRTANSAIVTVKIDQNEEQIIDTNAFSECGVYVKAGEKLDDWWNDDFWNDAVMVKGQFTGDKTFTCEIPNLTGGTYYGVKPYVIYNGAKNTQGYSTFNTYRIPSINDNPSPTKQ